MTQRISRFLEVTHKSGCGCKKLADQMDIGGITWVQTHRSEIVDHLVANKEILADSFSSNSIVSAAIGWVLGTGVTDSILRRGAEWLVDQSIEDVRKEKSARTIKSIRQSPNPQSSGRRFYARGRAAFCPPLVGVPIDRNRLQSHILYHVMPLSGETEWVWRRHCDWLCEVRQTFNGRLIIGIVTPGQDDAWQYCPPEAVREALSGLGAEFIEAANDTGVGRNRKHARSGTGEGVLYPKMLGMLKTSDPDHVAFYGHCKAVTRPQATPNGAIHKWAEVMFDCLFRNHDEAVAALDTHGICGSLRMPGGYKDGGPGIGSNWFYSGTFFAMRLADVFARNWEYLPGHYGCVEQWPRLNFDKATQAACLFFDNCQNLYSEQYWVEEVTPALKQWKRDRHAR